MNNQNIRRVYVYTAVNGYAWQGCENERTVKDDLQRLIDDACDYDTLPAPDGKPTPKTPLGGIVSGTLSGKPGFAVWRVHTRVAGDFEYRSSRYIALVFLPFEEIDPSEMDFAKLWNAPQLREAQAGDVSALHLDVTWALNRPFRGISAASLKNAPSIPVPDGIARKDEPSRPLTLDKISSILDSGRWQFGKTTVTVYPGTDENSSLRVKTSYVPDKSVVDAEEILPKLSDLSSVATEAPETEKAAMAVLASLTKFAESRQSCGMLKKYVSAFNRQLQAYSQKSHDFRSKSEYRPVNENSPQSNSGLQSPQTESSTMNDPNRTYTEKDSLHHDTSKRQSPGGVSGIPVSESDASNGYGIGTGACRSWRNLAHGQERKEEKSQKRHFVAWDFMLVVISVGIIILVSTMSLSYKKATSRTDRPRHNDVPSPAPNVSRLNADIEKCRREVYRQRTEIDELTKQLERLKKGLEYERNSRRVLERKIVELTFQNGEIPAAPIGQPGKDEKADDSTEPAHVITTEGFAQ